MKTDTQTQKERKRNENVELAHIERFIMNIFNINKMGKQRCWNNIVCLLVCIILFPRPTIIYYLFICALYVFFISDATFNICETRKRIGVPFILYSSVVFLLVV